LRLRDGVEPQAKEITVTARKTLTAAALAALLALGGVACDQGAGDGGTTDTPAGTDGGGAGGGGAGTGGS
jgi:hypothetical protein